MSTQLSLELMAASVHVQGLQHSNYSDITDQELSQALNTQDLHTHGASPNHKKV